MESEETTPLCEVPPYDDDVMRWMMNMRSHMMQ